MSACSVTIVVPVMGHPVLMDDAIGSVVEAMAETAPGAARIDRLVVVDDGCAHEQTRRGLAAWRALLGPAMVWRSTPNRGLSAARNLGIELALAEGKPDAIFFLDADNRLARGATRAFGDLLAGRPGADWFYPEFDFFGRDGHFIGEASPTLTVSLLANHSEAGSLVRRRVLDAGVRFDESLRRGYEDWDFFLSATEQGFTGAPAARPMLEYRKRASSMLADSHQIDDELRRDLRMRHPRLFSPLTVLTAEAREFPRYAFWDVDAGVRLGSDPDAMRPSSEAQFERGLFAHFADAYANAAPQYVVAMEPDTEQALRKCGALRAVLWNLERAIVRTGNPVQLVHLNPQDDDGLALQQAAAPEGKSVVAMIATEVIGACLKQAPGQPLSALVGGRPGIGVGFWQLALPARTRVSPHFIRPAGRRIGTVPFEPPEPTPGGVPANEVLRDLLLRLDHSRFRPALNHSWEWRDPGGAVSRMRSVEAARNLAGGGIALPLVKKHAGLDIGFVLPIFSLGGVEKVVLRMSEALTAQGHACHLFVTGPHPIHLDGEATRVFASINPLPDPSAADWAGADFMGTNETSWGNPEELADLEGLLLPMDVVVNHHSAALHKIARRLRLKGVITIDHEHLVEVSDAGRCYGPPVLALAYENAYDRILTCSRGLADWLAAHGIPGEKLTPIVNAPGHALPPERIARILSERRARDPQEPLRVLYLGRFDRQKGIDRVVEIFARLQARAPSIRLTVAGSQVINRDLPVRFPEAVANLGPLRDADAVAAALADADILVLPSRYEGLPLVVLEAQRLGVVPIVTDVGAVCEAVSDGATGFIVPPSEAVAATTARILELDADRPLLARLSAQAAASSRTWAQAIRPLQRYLASVTKNRSAVAGRRAADAFHHEEPDTRRESLEQRVHADD